MPYVAFHEAPDDASPEIRRAARDRRDDLVHELRKGTVQAAAEHLRIEDYVVQAHVDAGTAEWSIVTDFQNRPGLESWSRTPSSFVHLIGPATRTIDGEEFGRRSLSPGDAIVHEDGSIAVSDGITFVRVPAVDRDAVLAMRTEDGDRTLGDVVAETMPRP